MLRDANFKIPNPRPSLQPSHAPSHTPSHAPSHTPSHSSLKSRDQNLTMHPPLAIMPTPGTLTLGGSLCNAYNATRRSVRGCDAVKYSQHEQACWDGGGNWSYVEESVCPSLDSWLQTGLVRDLWPWSPINRTNETFFNETTYNSSLILTLHNDSWVSSVGLPGPVGEALTRSILLGLRSSSEWQHGFNAIVRKALMPSMVERVSDAVLVVRVPAMPSYFIFEPEIISLR